MKIKNVELIELDKINKNGHMYEIPSFTYLPKTVRAYIHPGQNLKELIGRFDNIRFGFNKKNRSILIADFQSYDENKVLTLSIKILIRLGILKFCIAGIGESVIDSAMTVTMGRVDLRRIEDFTLTHVFLGADKA